uniref:Uncharacterized protein n=1 Tax=Chromera velia CCMP2878 TaxID=1169474 RepID=A0A0G4F9I3_9ALVE|eukprot:Cvel_15740.t1-p1 / transcript=Cvel_15740.t1 / gene=Cvel_15740 / organism=Chromera_velia_CCMP2878 / gene_product=hypothetical protein / transcript_product=hypothetical protein / location=Cvel_scaffold1177:48777-49355(+) / protein_length=193 / sequence_SO=supercontig / SO=protein_coding / is_pseudo=false
MGPNNSGQFPSSTDWAFPEPIALQGASSSAVKWAWGQTLDLPERKYNLTPPRLLKVLRTPPALPPQPGDRKDYDYGPQNVNVREIHDCVELYEDGRFRWRKEADATMGNFPIPNSNRTQRKAHFTTHAPNNIRVKILKPITTIEKRMWNSTRDSEKGKGDTILTSSNSCPPSNGWWITVMGGGDPQWILHETV